MSCHFHPKVKRWSEAVKGDYHQKPTVAEIETRGGTTGKLFSKAIWFQSMEKNPAENENAEREASVHELEGTRRAWNEGHLTRPKPVVFEKPVLPREGKKNVLITSVVPKVNNMPQFVNVIGCVSADVFARYCRLKNWNTLYVCGLDEFCTTTETKAAKEKFEPRELCNEHFEILRETFSWFNIHVDCFGRTNTAEQTAIAEELFRDIRDKEYTFVESVELFLCEICDRFMDDEFMVGTCPKCNYKGATGDQCTGCKKSINATELLKPSCNICNSTPILRSSEHIYFDLPKVEPELRKWIEATSHEWSNQVRALKNTWLKDNLKPFRVTRDLNCGTPVPSRGFENNVIYPWLNALLGYISTTASYTNEWRKWWQPAKDALVSLYQFMAKDDVPFHAILFPCMLIAADNGYKLVDHIIVTEHLNRGDAKLLKTHRTGVDTSLPADVFRFYLSYIGSESQDVSFCWNDFASKHNNELLNNIGNFVNRTLLFVHQHFEATIPKMTLNEADYTLLALVNRELVAFNSALQKVKLRDGVKCILNISRLGNQYMQRMKPWVLVKKSADDRTRAGTIVGLLCNLAALLAVLIEPYMPLLSSTMREQMNASHEILILTDEVTMLLPEGHKIGQVVPLFTKIDPSEVELLKKGLSPSSKKMPSLARMEAAVREQEDLVNNMKSTGVAECIWSIHVLVLNDMKKHFSELRAVCETTRSGTPVDEESAA